MTHDRTPEEIEAEIREERSALAESLEALSDRFSVDKIVASASDAIKTHGGELADTVMRGARENPVALGLMGAGLAWLLINGRNSDDDPQPTTAAYDTRPVPVSPGMATAARGPDAFAHRVESADAQIKGQADPHASRMDRVRQQVRQTAQEMRDRLHDNTETLGDLARARVIEARQKALSAQVRIEAEAARATRAGQRMFHDQPLAVGAGMMALGAVAAMALPRTQMEDETFGAERDLWVAQAERVFHEEMEHVTSLGRAAVDEGRDTIRKAMASVPDGDEAVERVEKAVSAKARDVADRAEADNRNH